MIDAFLLAFLPTIGPTEMLVILALGVLLFGKRLPEVGRSLGKGIVEFKKGLRGIEDEIDNNVDRSTANRGSERIDASAPKFDIPNDRYNKNDQPA